MKKTVVFAGGGTGGHIYPGLAIADNLREIDGEVRIVWIGSAAGNDKGMVEKSGSADKFYGIPCGKLRRYFSLRNFFDIFKIFAGVVASLFVILRERPSLLFSKGGFVSVPPCFAAYILGVPVWTHECDFSPGLATKINSRFAEKIFLSYDATRKFFGSKKDDSFVVCGNPVRPSFFCASPERGRKFLGLDGAKDPILLVLGGSSGARQINLLVAQNLPFLCEKFVVVHQTGGEKAQIEATLEQMQEEEKFAKSGRYKKFEFIFGEMCDVLACADAVLSRSGANSIWESAVCKKPMLLVPLEGAGTRGDQVENAQFFAEEGAAVVLRGKDLTDEGFCDSVAKFADKDFRDEMSKNVARLSLGKNPAKTIAERIGRFCGQ